MKLDYIEVDIEILRKIGGVLLFDIYICRAEGLYTKLFPKGDTIDEARLSAYAKDKGVEKLSVRAEDFKQYGFYVEQWAHQLFAKDRKVSNGELLSSLRAMVLVTTVELVVDLRVDEKSVQTAGQTVQGCIKLLDSDPQKFVQILKMIAAHPYGMRHAVMTAFLSIMLAKYGGMPSEKSQQIVGLGALLHDIGMSRLTFDPESREHLTPDEWREVQTHPELGKRLLDTIVGVPPEAKAIVIQHHEQPNGNGYPNGLREGELYVPAKIVAIADAFAALVSVRPFRPTAMTALQAIETLQGDRGKYDRKLLKAFSGLFVKLKG